MAYGCDPEKEKNLREVLGWFSTDALEILLAYLLKRDYYAGREHIFLLILDILRERDGPVDPASTKNPQETTCQIEETMLE